MYLSDFLHIIITVDIFGGHSAVMIISLFDIGMQTVYGIEVKDSSAFFMTDIYNCTVCKGFQNVIAAQAIRKDQGIFRYMSLTIWFCMVYRCSDDLAITLYSGTDRDISI